MHSHTLNFITEKAFENPSMTEFITVQLLNFDTILNDYQIKPIFKHPNERLCLSKEKTDTHTLDKHVRRRFEKWISKRVCFDSNLMKHDKRKKEKASSQEIFH